MKVLKVPRLPHRSSLGSSKRTCHTKRGGVHTGQARRQASAYLYESTESATPVTRIEPEELPRSLGVTEAVFPTLCCVLMC